MTGSRINIRVYQETRQANCFTLLQIMQQVWIRSTVFTNLLASDKENMCGNSRGTIKCRESSVQVHTAIVSRVLCFVATASYIVNWSPQMEESICRLQVVCTGKWSTLIALSPQDAFRFLVFLVLQFLISGCCCLTITTARDQQL